MFTESQPEDTYKNAQIEAEQPLVAPSVKTTLAKKKKKHKKQKDSKVSLPLIVYVCVLNGGNERGMEGGRVKLNEGERQVPFSLSGDSCLTLSMWDSCEMRQGSRSRNANGQRWMVDRAGPGVVVVVGGWGLCLNKLTWG